LFSLVPFGVPLVCPVTGGAAAASWALACLPAKDAHYRQVA